MSKHAQNLGNWRYAVNVQADALPARVEQAAKLSISRIGEHIKAESNAIAPLREGTMIESSRVEPIEDGLTVRVSYNTVYSRYQHNVTTLHHPNGRQALYLQSVMDSPATAAAVADIFAAQIKKMIGG